MSQVLSGLNDLVRQRVSAVARKRIARIAVFALVPLLTQACASTSSVVQTGDAGRFTLHASAAGGSAAWARSHKAVMQSANDFCAQRGEVPSVVSESSKGVRALEAHEADLTFECHPRF
ncbi:hypothetical protein ACFQ3P_24545 [Paraburkholderia sabiae]|uniref:Lipoprotein n=1 Tax=Paraburkholderia sabiae TaxID=273251 RepID=A0ABU9QQ80_9BURK|nr:hypothetical protein [Paraburkholderia sabiae]WJZ76319.1 hypothetical protein QEN71_11080 [Paraburkholderia sabiae]